jgi:hypothetical protein
MGRRKSRGDVACRIYSTPLLDTTLCKHETRLQHQVTTNPLHLRVHCERMMLADDIADSIHHDSERPRGHHNIPKFTPSLKLMQPARP